MGPQPPRPPRRPSPRPPPRPPPPRRNTNDKWLCGACLTRHYYTCTFGTSAINELRTPSHQEIEQKEKPILILRSTIKDEEKLFDHINNKVAANIINFTATDICKLHVARKNIGIKALMQILSVMVYPS